MPGSSGRARFVNPSKFDPLDPPGGTNQSCKFAA